MAHVAKYSRAAIGHMFAHYERAKDSLGNYIKFGNENIDTEKSHLNYNLAPNHGMNQGEFIRKRCSEVKCLKRKDVNVMCTWVVTAPKDLAQDQERDFFEQTYKFLENRYGKQNVVSSFVHMDEVQPHMHFAFVPVVYDKDKGIEKVSAKVKVSKSDLMSFHKDLQDSLEHHFGYRIGVLNNATKEGNKSIIELKRGTAQEKLESLEQSIKRMDKHAYKLQDDIKTLRNELKAMDGIKLTQDKLDAIQGKIGAFNKDKVSIDISDFETLKLLAQKSCLQEHELSSIKSDLEHQVQVNQNYKKQINVLTQENKFFKNKSTDLSEKNMILKELLKKKGMDHDAIERTLEETQSTLKQVRSNKKHSIEVLK